VVIGFGINVNIPRSSFPKELEPMATSLQIQSQQAFDRHHLITTIITTLEQGWEALISMGPKSCQLAYRTRCSTLGSHIQAQLPDGRQLDGVAKTIGTQGQLQMLVSSSDPKEQSARIVDIHVGDIRHIRKLDVQ
jgi:BirA family biotin operon repressor/biotin-[acetyl-CoA-carboxylase] ligase